MSLNHKLNRFKTQIVRDAHDPLNKNTKELDKPTKFKSLPYLEQWEQAGATTYLYGDEYCLIREKRFPLSYQHGHYQFADFLKAMEIWQNFSGNHPLSTKGMLPQDLYFFDTETTGLYGGAGNCIFLLGHAQFVNNEVILKQHFLPEPGFEVPLYKSFLEVVDYSTLVTYNGKAFDFPQVKTQHTLVREHVPKLPAFGHFDLYHAARRLWKSKLEAVKLANVETDILGVQRKDDIPGYLAPMIYFDFVERKNPEAILKVLEHNEIDILSLITLFTHLTYQIHSIPAEQTANEKMLIGKWYQYIGEREIAATHYEAAAKAGDISAKHQLAYFLKRAGQFEAAKQLWLEVVNGKELRIKREAYIELAKLMEHQFKNFNLAVEYTQAALSIECSKSFSNETVFVREAKKRLTRLMRKLT